MKKAILIDLDGTLVDTESLDDLAMTRVLKNNGFALKESFIGCTLEEYILKITRNKRIQKKIKAEFLEEYQLLLKNEKLSINYKLLKLIKKESEIKIVLVTSNKKKLVRIILEKIKLEQFFDLIVTSEDTVKQKPHPEPYLKAIEILNLNPSECVAYEDTETGQKSAQLAGIKCNKIKFES